MTTERLSPQTGTAFSMSAGDVLRVIDPEGEQVADLIAFSREPRPAWLSAGRTFDYNDTATRIMDAYARGEKYDLVVLTTDSGIMALDDVYVASASFAGGSSPAFLCSFQAQAVRWV